MHKNEVNIVEQKYILDDSNNILFNRLCLPHEKMAQFTTI